MGLLWIGAYEREDLCDLLFSTLKYVKSCLLVSNAVFIYSQIYHSLDYSTVEVAGWPTEEGCRQRT